MQTIYQKITKLGKRITKTRRAILEILVQESCLLDKKTLLQKLQRKKINPDRTTLYRELLFLTEHQIVNKSLINGVGHYEIANFDHHHHLICLNCNHIQKVILKNTLTKQEKILSQKNNFTITNHQLDFYGYCAKCQL